MISKEQLKAEIDQLPDDAAVERIYRAVQANLLVKGTDKLQHDSRSGIRKDKKSLIGQFISCLMGRAWKRKKTGMVLRDFQGRFDKENVRIKAYD